MRSGGEPIRITAERFRSKGLAEELLRLGDQVGEHG